MSGIFGLAGLNVSDYQFVQTAGQKVIYDATRAYLERVNRDTNDSIRVFVGSTIEEFQERYKLPGGGRLQKRGEQARTGAVKANGGWDVAYPLEDFGAQVATTDVDMAYMSPQEYQNHVDTVVIQDSNTVRFEILRALFNNTARTFADKRRGDLTIQPLANGDTVVYPPVLGSETEAADDHYLESGYASSAISDTNNPFPTVRDELEEHFGAETGGENIVAFINQAQTAKVSALTAFDEVIDKYIRAGDNTNIPINLPHVPGRIIGRINGVWVSEWRYIPANYMLNIHLEEEPPLKMRVDPAATGLPRGLTLVAKEEDYPIQSSEWRHRFGVGAGNRLNGVVMEFGTGGTYTIPTAFQ